MLLNKQLKEHIHISFFLNNIQYVQVVCNNAFCVLLYFNKKF